MADDNEDLLKALQDKLGPKSPPPSRVDRMKGTARRRASQAGIVALGATAVYLGGHAMGDNDIKDTAYIGNAAQEVKIVLHKDGTLSAEVPNAKAAVVVNATTGHEVTDRVEVELEKAQNPAFTVVWTDKDGEVHVAPASVNAVAEGGPTDFRLHNVGVTPNADRLQKHIKPTASPSAARSASPTKSARSMGSTRQVRDAGGGRGIGGATL